ncbi:unnamed protein product [Diabrotica balteata]|uniref:Cytochrome P450 n=1 Tax=Diabrotica balteata TaxID=107213 RepID=A0A9N9SN48_DIABA|nr:unnamed protein product [Diabrotica balteata]
MLQLVLIAIVIVLFYYYAIRPMNYWKKRGVIQGRPIWLFGDNWKALFRLETFGQPYHTAYNLDPDARYVGFYQFTVPTLMIKDPKLLKEITVKDSEYFTNHRAIVPDEGDPLWTKNLLALKDQKWKDMRHILTPSFTSSKMKMMFTLMVECAENFVMHFHKKGQDVFDVSIKDVTTRFANDVVASTAFGIRTDSLEEQNNEFYLMGRDMTDFTSLRKGLKFFGFFIMPKILQFFNVQLFDGPSRNFFIDLIDKNLKLREDQNIVRPDMLQLLIEAKKSIHQNEKLNANHSASTKEITNIEITAHALIFFFAGFDSVSSLMCFMSYELALNPDIQARLRKEIDDGFKKCNGRMTYETLMGMKYLDMVISESLRKWPNFQATDRECNKRYIIQPEGPNEKPIVIEKGDLVSLPIAPMHYDPKYFPDPERFDPERFSDENKDNIEPYTYLPFGLGPRNCIGSRFAILETKTLFAHLLHSFQIVPNEKTKIPVELSKKTINLFPVDGMQLSYRRLKK